VLNREDEEKCFYLYDIFHKRFSRKMKKEDFANVKDASVERDSESEPVDSQEEDPEARFQSDAFAVDHKANILIYAYGRTLKV
jgi:hypothetical protein